MKNGKNKSRTPAINSMSDRLIMYKQVHKN